MPPGIRLGPSSQLQPLSNIVCPLDVIHLGNFSGLTMEQM